MNNLRYHHVYAAPMWHWSPPGYGISAYYMPTPGKPHEATWCTPPLHPAWNFYAPAPPRVDLGYSTSPQRHPTLHPLLAHGTTHQRIDVRTPARNSVRPALYERYRNEPATRPPAARVRLVSDEVPWIVDVRAAPGASGVTCGDVWKALHQALQEPLQDSEWALVAVLEGAGSVRRREIVRAAAVRSAEGGAGLLRADFLGERTAFTGLDKDPELARKMLVPGREEWPETWVVRFDKRSEN